MIQQPATSAGAILEKDRTKGKFQGQMAPTTPSGTYLVVAVLFSSSMVSTGSLNLVIASMPS